VWSYVRVLRSLHLCVCLALPLLAASCGAQPTDLQANLRAAAAHAPAAAASRPAARDERIENLLAAVASGHEGDGLPARIEALLRRDDDAVRAVLAFIRGDKATKMIVDALAASGTPAAQDALCALARDVHVPAHVRAEAVSSLGLIKHPTAPTMTEVAALIHARDPALIAPALFLAGSVARAGRAEHPAHAAAIEKVVLAESTRARTSDEVLDALAALGNLGSANVLPRLRAAVAAPDPRIRAAATRALRLVPDAEADRLLATTLRRDHDPTVRAAAIFAAGFRKLDPLLADALADTAQADPVEYVRAGAVTLLAHNRQASPRVERALANVASTDPKPDLRRLAAGDAR
jgi:HEAT repeat protein